ncbi:MAG TPA: hypothetical protein VHK27_01175, partial [Gammaproteobacteria bacterium]|nr:hypothetical protein [Gammaproteobacteria bacterium]
MTFLIAQAQLDHHAILPHILPGRIAHPTGQTYLRLVWLIGIHPDKEDPPLFDAIPTTLEDVALLQGIRQMAAYIGMPAHEIEQLIAWRVKPFDEADQHTYYSLLKVHVDVASQTSNEDEKWNKIQKLQEMWVKYQITK